MKTIRLNSIHISEWRGKNIDVDFNGDITKVSAKNEVGKTTLFNAWCWVFTSYTSSTSLKNEELFDNTKELTHETPIASVKLCIDIDGVKHTIERTAQAKFSRPQGNTEYVKSPTDNYTIAVDGFTISAKEFTQWVEDNICQADLLPYLLDGSFFTTLMEEDRAKARKALNGIIGSIGTSDFMGDYGMIEEMLDRCTPEQLIANSNAQKRKLDEQLANLAGILSDAKKRRSAIDEVEIANIRTQIQRYKDEIKGFDSAIEKRTKAKLEREKLYAMLGAKRAEYTNAKSKYIFDFDKKLSELKTRQSLAEFEKTKMHYEHQAKQNRQVGLAEKIEVDNLLICSARERIDELKSSMAFHIKCPHCGGDVSMPNSTESNTKVANEISALESTILAAQQRISEAEKKLATVEVCGISDDNLVSELQVEIDNLTNNLIQFDATAAGVQMIAEIEELEKQIEGIDVKDTTILEEARQAVIGKVEELLVQLGKCGDAEQLDKEIATWQWQYRATGNNIVHLEGVVAKAKEYIEEKAQIISERINSKLDGYRVQMYSTQKDGTRVPDCVVVDSKGVKFATLSNSARIRANIQMQELFGKSLGVSMPTWIDECSIFDEEHLPKPCGQTIYLFAGNSDNLVVE